MEVGSCGRWTENTWHLLARLPAHTAGWGGLGFTPGIITDTTHPFFEGLSRLLIKDVPGFLSDVGLHRA